MKRYSASCFSALMLGLILVLVRPAAAGEPEDSVRNVILSQILAFADDDAAAAWRFASDGIQQQFGSADVFIEMVRNAYPAVYRASTVQFEDLILHAGFVIQNVTLTGPQGKRWKTVYTLVESEGAWRIGGVTVARAEAGI